MHDIPTNYLYTDVEVRGNSFKETVTEGNEQKKIVLEKPAPLVLGGGLPHLERKQNMFKKDVL